MLQSTYVENFAIFDIKRLFLLYFNIDSERPKLAYQIRSNFAIAET